MVFWRMALLTNALTAPAVLSNPMDAMNMEEYMHPII